MPLSGWRLKSRNFLRVKHGSSAYGLIEVETPYHIDQFSLLRKKGSQCPDHFTYSSDTYIVHVFIWFRSCDHFRLVSGHAKHVEHLRGCNLSSFNLYTLGKAWCIYVILVTMFLRSWFSDLMFSIRSRCNNSRDLFINKCLFALGTKLRENGRPSK